MRKLISITAIAAFAIMAFAIPSMASAQINVIPGAPTGGFGGSPYDPGYDPGTPPTAEPIVHPPSVMLFGSFVDKGKFVLTNRVNTSGVVTGKIAKGKTLLAKGSKTTKSGSVKLVLNPTKAGKRLIKTKASFKAKVTVTLNPNKGATVKTTRGAAKFKG